ncbi:MAG: TIGR02270 family protein [Agarilytica sp.]
MGLASPVRAYSDVVDQFVNDASFLWVLRSVAHDQPHYAVADLHELETRIQKQLDGLFVEPELAWELIQDALEFEEAGEVFTATVFAFRSREVEKIKAAVNAGMKSDETRRGLISAMAWLPQKLVHAWLTKFYQSKDLSHKTLALSVSISRRENPEEYIGKILNREDCLAIPNLYAEALKSVGVFKRADLKQYLLVAADHEVTQVQFWAIWALALLGDRQFCEKLKPFVVDESDLQQQAIQLAFRCLPISVAREWIKELIATPENIRLAVKAVAALGDPEAINWLIGLMRNTTHSRLASEAFSMITGIDIEANELAFDLPDLEDALPGEEAEGTDQDDVAMDEDENLPWPNADKIQAIWQKYGNRFHSGKRYLMGKEIGAQNHGFFDENTQIESALKKEDSFLQRQRHAAAIELALAHPSLPYLNTNAKVIG